VKSRRGGLGRGLGALIPGAVEAPAAGAALVPLESIRPNPQQPRRHFDEAELEALADSIREHGVLQPLVVTREGAGHVLIAGERRLRAARLAGLAEVPVVFRETQDPLNSLALSLVENIQRHDLNALEEAEAYRQLVEDFALTQETVARQVGRSRAHVANSLRLLGLAPAVRSALLGGAITAGHARALAALDPAVQETALRRILREEMNVRETEALARELAAKAPSASPPAILRPPPSSADLVWLENAIRDALQAKVRLVRRRRGGRLVIDWFDDEELDALYARLVGASGLGPPIISEGVTPSSSPQPRAMHGGLPSEEGAS
jgi:ParB family chromosome partitioning protein